MTQISIDLCKMLIAISIILLLLIVYCIIIISWKVWWDTMFYSNHIIALDFGTKCIKIIYGKKTGSGATIFEYGIYDVPDVFFSNKGIMDEDYISKVLTDFLSIRKIKSKNVSLGIKGHDIIIRHLQMPVMSDKQLKQAVKYELQQYLTMDLSDYSVGSKKLSEIICNGKRTMDVLLVAAPMKKINDYLNLITKVGLRVKLIDIFANSITAFFKSDEKAIKDSLALLDIGFSSSSIILIEGSKLFFQKEINIGSKHILESLDDKFSLCKEAVLNTLAEEILRILDFYTSHHPSKKINCLYLYGGGSNILNIVDSIRNLINIETKLFDESLLGNIINIDSGLKKNIHLYLNCISLLLKS